jgi:hypothetical protein
MDEIQLIKEFRSDLPGASGESRQRARERLEGRFERRRFLALGPRSPRAAVWVAVALLAGLLAGSALAFGGRLVDSIRGKPAPEDVRQHLGYRSTDVFHYVNPVITSRAHGVMEFSTSAGRASLWAAPRSDGLTCLWAKVPLAKPYPQGSSPADRYQQSEACFGRERTLRGRPVKVLSWSDSGEPKYVIGIATRKVHAVEVRLLEGGARRAKLYDGIFAVGTPPGFTPVSATAFDAQGQKLGVDTFWPEPSIPAPTNPKRTGPFVEKVVAEQDGYRVAAFVAPASRGGLCYDVESTGTRHRSFCAHPNRGVFPVLWPWEGPPAETRGDAAIWAFVFGQAREGVADVELRFEDGASSTVPLSDDRFFVAFVTGMNTKPGHRPRALVARNSAGRVIGTARLDQ